MKQLQILMACTGAWMISSCNPWPAPEAEWFYPIQHTNCGIHITDVSRIHWRHSEFPDTVVNWTDLSSSTWRIPGASVSPQCTLEIISQVQTMDCSSAEITWDEAGNGFTLHSQQDPLAVFLLDHLTSSAENTLACHLWQTPDSLRSWWNLLPKGVNAESAIQAFSRSLGDSGISLHSLGELSDLGYLPWDSLTLDSLVFSAVQAGVVTREQYLGWPAKIRTKMQTDSILLADSSGSQREWRKVGPCPPSSQIFEISLAEVSIPECDSQDTWEGANRCANRLNARLPTLSEWKCALGLWNDTFPAPPSQMIRASFPANRNQSSPWPPESLPPYPFGMRGVFGNRAEWLADPGMNGSHFLIGGDWTAWEELLRDPLGLQEIRPLAVASNAGIRLVRPPPTTPECANSSKESTK